MTLSLLSSRDADPNIMFTLSFNVSFGPPSRIICYLNNTRFTHEIGRFPQPGVLDREVIRSHYVNSSQPDVTRVTVTRTQSRVGGSYCCNVTVEGRVDLNDTNLYNYHTLGTGSSSTTVTGECVTAVLDCTAHYPALLPSVAGTPTAVTANRTGLTSVLVSWSPPSPAPDAYEVFYQAAGGSRLNGGNTSNTQLTLSALTLGESYSIFVIAFGADGTPVLPSAHSFTANISLCELVSCNYNRCSNILYPFCSCTTTDRKPNYHP